jgi:hypothetical protein
MLMFRVLGSWVRGLYLMGFGAFWLAMSYYLSRSGGMGGNTTMTTMGAIGGLSLVSGAIVILRAVAMTSERATLPKGSAGWRDDGKPAASDSGFDADAAIARYLEKRPETAEPAVAPEPAVAVAPPRPAFGRKQA